MLSKLAHNLRLHINYHYILIILLLLLNTNLVFTQGVNTLGVFQYHIQNFGWDLFMRYPPGTYSILSTILSFFPLDKSISFTSQTAWILLKFCLSFAYLLTWLSITYLAKANSKKIQVSPSTLAVCFLASFPIQFSAISFSFLEIFAAPFFILSISFLFKNQFIKSAIFNILTISFNWTLLIFSPIFFIYYLRNSKNKSTLSKIFSLLSFIVIPAITFIFYMVALARLNSVFFFHQYNSNIFSIPALVKLSINFLKDANKANLLLASLLPIVLLAFIMIIVLVAKQRVSLKKIKSHKFFLILMGLITFGISFLWSQSLTPFGIAFLGFYLFALYKLNLLPTLSISTFLIALSYVYATFILLFPGVNEGNIIWPIIISLLLYAFSANTVNKYFFVTWNILAFINLFAFFGIAGNPTIFGLYFDFFKIIFAIFFITFSIYYLNLASNYQFNLSLPKLNKEKTKLIYLLIALLVTINLSFITGSGTHDHMAWSQYAVAATQNNPFLAHIIVVQMYPPLSTVIIGFFANLWKEFVGIDPTYHTATKIGLFTFYSLSIFMYLIFSKIYQKRANFSLAGNLLILLSVFSLAIHSQGWGQIDIYTLPPVIAAVIFLFRNNYLLSGLFLGISFATKWQPVLFLPVFLATIFNLRENLLLSIKRLIIFIFALIVAPSISWGLVLMQPGGQGELNHAIGWLLSGLPYISGMAFNVDWILTYLFHIFDPVRYVPLSAYDWFNYPIATYITPIFIQNGYLFYIAVLVILGQYWLFLKKDLPHFLNIMFMVAFTHFMLNKGAYDKHIFYALIAVVLLYLAKPTAQNLRLLLLVDLIAGINLILSFGLTGNRELNPIFFKFDLTVAVAVCFVAIYFWLFYKYIRGQGEIDLSQN